MIRRAWRRAGPWLTPALIAVEVALVWSGELGLRTAVVVGLAVETLLWIAALEGIAAGIRRFRAGRATGMGAWQAAEDGLARLVPRPVAKVILFEPRLWICLTRWITGRYPRDPGRAFRYDASLRPIVWIALALVVIEGAVVDIVLELALPGTIWVWVSLGVHVYALLIVLGFLASWITRPHLLTENSLRVRDGIVAEMLIPYDAITTVRVAVRSNFGRSGLRVDETRGTVLLGFGDTNVDITLDPARAARITGHGHHSALTALALTADAPHDIVRALRRRTTEGSRAGVR